MDTPTQKTTNQPVAKTPRYIRTKLALPKSEVFVYAGVHVSEALKVIEKQTVWEGVKLLQLLEAVYVQGKKDGAKAVFDSVDSLKRKIPHRNPGQPSHQRK